MAGANLATPLYAVYARHFHFSSLVLTAIFATYAFVLVPALVLFGRLSDRFGRRPVILAGLAAAVAALVLFALAGGTAWLFGARALQGLAGAAATLTIPGSSADEREPWRLQWPRVPAEIRGRFALVALTGATVWAAVALYLSIVPSYAASLLKTHDLALLAAISAIALLASCGSQVLSQRREGNRRRDQLAGLVVLALGLFGLVLAAPLHSLALLVVGAVLTGAGHWVGFLDAQQELKEIAPDDR